MFKKWFSKRKKDNNSTPISPLNKISDSFYHGRYKECIEKAEAEFENTDIELASNAKRFVGLANYRLKRYEAATRIFETIANSTRNTDDWFNLMTASIRNHEIELGENAYDQFNNESSVKGDNRMLTYSNVTYQMMIAYQDVGEFKKALANLLILKRYITQVKHQSSDYLGTHGVPFVYQTLVAGQACLEHEYNPEQIERFLEDFERHVDDDGKESIAEFRKTFSKKL